MLGIAARIAQRLGIHNESILAKHTPFEAEMRRRLWWALMRLDTRIGEMADYKITMLIPAWDCKIPLNVNDSDLRPGMKEPPAAQSAPTEALFVVVCSELGNFIGKTELCLGFTTPALTQHLAPTTSSELTALEERIEDVYLRSCLPENPLHFMTIWTARGFVAKYRLIEHYARCVSPTTSSMQQTEAQRDTAISYAFTILDCDTKIGTSPLTKGYLWLTHFYFPFPAYVHIIQDMKRRPLSKHAEQAWEVMSDNCEARFTAAPNSKSPLIRMFAKVILPGWDTREAALKQSGETIVLPRIISILRYHLTRHVQTPSANEQSSGHPNFDIDSCLMSMPMGFGADSLFYNMSLEGLYGFQGPGLYGGMPGQISSDFTQNQAHWTMMDWNASERRSLDT